MTNFNLKSRFALLLVILVAPLAGVSAAGLIDSGTSGASAVTGTARTSTTGTGSVNAGTNGTSGSGTAGVNTNVKTNVSGSVNGSTNGSAKTGSNANGNINATGNVSDNIDSNTDENSNGVLNVSRDSEDLSAHTGTMSSTNVASQSDLKAFARAELIIDENLSSMAFASDRVEVMYKEHARFFGIIPTSVNVNVVAHNDGTVDINYPWYSFLMVTSRGELESSIKSEVNAYMSQHASANTSAAANTNTNAQSNWNAKANAELATRIEAALRAHLNGSTATTASTQSSY
jgi:hypothetical protein